ncbi:hypothetical protein O9929_13525 [Vibrio lentus]|nr:hypothetical protein [Vibrio lentus]
MASSTATNISFIATVEVALAVPFADRTGIHTLSAALVMPSCKIAQMGDELRMVSIVVLSSLLYRLLCSIDTNRFAIVVWCGSAEAAATVASISLGSPQWAMTTSIT